ncbi:unnamed protein product [Pylaiella littoralis]
MPTTSGNRRRSKVAARSRRYAMSCALSGVDTTELGDSVCSPGAKNVPQEARVRVHGVFLWLYLPFYVRRVSPYHRQTLLHSPSCTRLYKIRRTEWSDDSTQVSMGLPCLMYDARTWVFVVLFPRSPRPKGRVKTANVG